MIDPNDKTRKYSNIYLAYEKRNETKEIRFSFDTTTKIFDFFYIRRKAIAEEVLFKREWTLKKGFPLTTKALIAKVEKEVLPEMKTVKEQAMKMQVEKLLAKLKKEIW